MPSFKKFILATIFLVSFILLISQLPLIFKSYDFIFSLSLDTLIQLLTISSLITLSSFSFSLFASLALDWKIILPVGILTSMIPFIFIDPASAVVFMVGILVSLLFVFIGLKTQMKSYLTFNPNSILGPPIRHLSTLLIITISIIYFLSASKMISEKGFTIPDSLIDTALKFAAPSTEQSENPTPQISIPKEQLELLKKNPDLLKQSGLDPKILDNLDNPRQNIQQTPNNLIKQTVMTQVQSLLKPYLGLIPAILAALLFFSLQSLTSILNFLIFPLLWLTFYVFEKTGFVKFVIEERPVKKMFV